MFGALEEEEEEERKKEERISTPIFG